MSVCVVGSGVIGLTTAVRLVESRPDIKTLTIVSNQFPDDRPISHTFTSPWAGAHFRPFPHKKSDLECDKRESKYTRVTYEYFKRKSDRWLNDATVEFMKGIDWIEEPSEEYRQLGAGFNGKSLSNFKKESGVVPQGVTFAYSYDTWCLNAPIYLSFLYQQLGKMCQMRHIRLRIKRIRLNNLREVSEMYPDVTIIVNASGRGLQWDGGFDPKCHLIRGQTLLLDIGERHDSIEYSRCTITHQSKNGDWTFVIKRPGKNGANSKYILGGTKQLNDNRVMPRHSDTLSLIRRGERLFPELLQKYKIENVNVGFRPLRKGGSRVELERCDVDNDVHVNVIHAYGLGGMGFETSVGVANHVLELYDRTISSSKL